MADATARLGEIADQVRDGWIRGRGPLTGLKPLLAARQEAGRLEAGPDYLATFDEIIQAARAIAGSTPSRHRGEGPQTLERCVARLRALCVEDVG